jgi:hypothetical protein
MTTGQLYEVSISAAFTLLFLGGCALLALETYLLATGQPPITWHVRHAIHSFPRLAFAIAFGLGLAIGALFTHFYWSGAGGGY